MRAGPVFVAIVMMGGYSTLQAYQGSDGPSQRAALARAASEEPNKFAAQEAYAEFLERYGDPNAREAYGRALAAAQRANDKAKTAEASHSLAVLDLIAGDRDAAARHAEIYHGATGQTLPIGKPAGSDVWPTAPIPGPMRSFARMAAIAPDSNPRDILPALAHNVITNGYEASHGNEALEQTEYLKLVHRYLSQAHELEKLANDKRIIEVKSCDASNVADLLRVLGFRMRGGCGSEVVLETVNAARAFLTTDSGFPVNQLEDALRTNRPFTYDCSSVAGTGASGCPEYWMPNVKDAEPAGFIESFIGDPSTCRLYLGFSKLDAETADALKKADTYAHLKAYSHVLDFLRRHVRGTCGQESDQYSGGQRSARLGPWN